MTALVMDTVHAEIAHVMPDGVTIQMALKIVLALNSLVRMTALIMVNASVVYANATQASHSLIVHASTLHVPMVVPWMVVVFVVTMRLFILVSV
jgi:hypothetical protein